MSVEQSPEEIDWSDDNITQLIEECNYKPWLWNPNCESESWKEVSDSLNIEIEPLKKKWKYLLQTYRKERLEQSKPRAKRNFCTPTWPYYYEMKFMETIYIPLQTLDTEEENEIDWSDVKTGRLIYECKTRPPLWNPKCESESWEQISINLGIEIEPLKKKWKELMETFRKEHIKSEIKSWNLYYSNWPFFNKMYFLTYANIPFQLDTEEENEVIDLNEGHVVTEGQKAKKARLEDGADADSNPLKPIAEDSEKKEKCEEEVYGELYAIKLKSYDLNTKHEVIRNFNEVLRKADLGCFKNSNSHSDVTQHYHENNNVNSIL